MYKTYRLEDLLKQAVDMKASDVHIKRNVNPVMRVDGELLRIGSKVVTAEEIKTMVQVILKDRVNEFNKIGEVDVGYEINKVGRFRVNVFKEMGRDCIAIRIINNNIISLDDISFNDSIKEFTKEERGLILVSGATGSGKSTTIASLIEEINKTESKHIITLEDPVEYVYKEKKSINSQREIGKDTRGFKEGVRSALREDPDVILIGEMRDADTISMAINAAETGHLVFSTIHTFGACETIDRIVNEFPKALHEQIKLQLSLVLKGVIWQKLIKKCNGEGRCAAMEVMKVIPSIKNLIREGKTYQIQSVIQTGSKYGMITTDRYISELYKMNAISVKLKLINLF